jgi:L-asparaginase
MAGVSNLEATIHSSQIAASLLDQQDRCLTGFAATQYARSLGVPFESPETAQRIEEWRARLSGSTGTVGSVSLDQHGDPFAVTSTGGRGFERPGRVSDSCTPAGNFATHSGAVSCTGVGEDILDSGLAVAILTRLEDGMTLQEATLKSFARFYNKRFGIIAIDTRGEAIVHATEGTLGFGLVGPKILKVGLTSKDWQKVFEAKA